MDVIFNNRQRPILQLPQVIEALERLRDDPQQLARERDRLYTEPPPPYSEDSGETTEPEPNEPPTATVDKTYQRRLRREAHWKSTPINQFESQAQRERERLLHQISARTSGRRQTLPWDNSLDLKANPENNVRSRWVEQGIWGDNWGPAWPKNSQPLTTKWLHEGGGPFQGDYNPATSESRPGARWGHEEPDPEPEPESESESESGPQQESARGREEGSTVIGGIFAPRKPEQPKAPRRRPIGYIQTHWGPVPRYPIPIPTVRNPEASRPYHQFVYQISKEREWIQDEMAHTAPGSVFDLDAMAYESVKNNWIKDGVWHPEWNDQPGMRWKHEEPEPEDEDEDEDERVGEASHAASNPSSRRPSETADGRQRPLTRYPNPFGQSPTPADGGPAEASRGTEAVLPSLSRNNVRSRPGRSKRSRESDTTTEQAPKRSRYNTRHSTNAVTDSAPLERAVSTSKRKGGEGVGATSVPPRRSARIAARNSEKQTVPPEPQRRQPRSVQAKTVKRARPRHGGRERGDQNGTPRPERNARKGVGTKARKK